MAMPFQHIEPQTKNIYIAIIIFIYTNIIGVL